MKRRLGILTIVAAALALLAGACDDGRYYDYSGRPYGRVACGQFTTCDVCTPVLGCGWCQLASGGGVCAEGPQDCPPAPLASWTWDPVGCHHDAGSPADASISGPDSGTVGPQVPPPPNDASVDTGAGEAPSDAASGG